VSAPFADAAAPPVAARPAGAADLPGLAGAVAGKQRSAPDDVSVIAGAAYLVQVINFFAGLVQKAILGPVGLGYWALMQSFWQISKAAQLGAFDGTSRQIPFYRGRGDYESAAAVSDTGFCFSLIAVSIVGVCMATAALAFGSDWAPELQYGLLLLGLTAPLRLLSDCHLVLLHATRRFRPASTALILQALTGLTLQTLLVALFGFYGMFAGAVAVSIGTLAYLAHKGLAGFRRPAFGWHLDRTKVRELMAYGFPYMVFSQIWLLFMGIDNLIIAGFIDVKSLGYYALAVSVTSYILHLPRSISQALFPRMAERFGKTGDVTSLAPYAVDAQRMLAYMLVPIFVAGAFFFFPLVIRHALPEFRPGIEVVHIMVAGTFVMALCNLPIKAMLTAGRQRVLIVLVTICLAVNAAANYVAVAVLDRGIEGAAVATVFSYFVVFVLTSGYALSIMIGRRAMLAQIAVMLTVAVYVAAALWSIELLVGSGEGPFIPDALTATVKLALFGVLLTPWLVLAEKRVRGLSRMRDFARAGLHKLLRR